MRRKWVNYSEPSIEIYRRDSYIGIFQLDDEAGETTEQMISDIIVGRQDKPLPTPSRRPQGTRRRQSHFPAAIFLLQKGFERQHDARAYGFFSFDRQQDRESS